MSDFGTKQTLRGSVPMSVMDGMIRMVYGANPPPKSADIERSITIAHEDLLFEKVPLSEVKRTAGELFKGPVPYSTHDLAVSPAFVFVPRLEMFFAIQKFLLPISPQDHEIS
jgi:hypothetical protein